MNEQLFATFRAALRDRNAHELERVLNAGLELDLANTPVDGVLPLHDAVVREFPQGVDLLLRFGADARGVDADGLTALHLAAVCKSCSSIAHLLLDAGADINARTKGGSTPRDVATALGNADAAQFFAAMGGRTGRVWPFGVDSQLGRGLD